ncbi:MAG: ATP-binding cassette domain-containing protein [Candidatus Nanoarchaeia archaeon]|nr:ATP-binding cassette domain-containing protein [Candidatus Nanoarchaeia archaeon]
MPDNIIEVKNVSKSFKKYKRGDSFFDAFKSLFHREFERIHALKNVNFEIKKGEILGYLGPNGAGKSTMIKLMCGILEPDSGTIKALNYTPSKDREKYVKNIGAVFGQKSNLWTDLPAIDTFRLNKEIYKISEHDYKKRLDELVELLDVKEIIKSPVRNLSFGERMKCEFIASLLHNPKILFLDEPTVGVDVVAKQNIRNFIKKINKEFGVTVILTTHDIGDVESLCDRIIILDKGVHVYEGSIPLLKKNYLSYKELIVYFEKETKNIELPNCEVIESEPFKATLRVDILNTSISQAIQNLMEKYKVEDLDIKEESIESIISRIYKSEKK